MEEGVGFNAVYLAGILFEETEDEEGDQGDCRPLRETGLRNRVEKQS